MPIILVLLQITKCPVTLYRHCVDQPLQHYTIYYLNVCPQLNYSIFVCTNQPHLKCNYLNKIEFNWIYPLFIGMSIDQIHFLELCAPYSLPGPIHQMPSSKVVFTYNIHIPSHRNVVVFLNMQKLQIIFLYKEFDDFGRVTIFCMLHF